MKSKIHYTRCNQKIYSDTDATILDISIKNKITHFSECGGNGKCSSCRVRVLEGMQNLSEKTILEKEMEQNRKWDPSIRLACQAFVKGDVKVEHLIWSSSEINHLQKELINDTHGEERPIAILFCDLRNFTPLSERNQSSDMARILNKFYTSLSEPILMNNGIIYQYVGDEIVGIFGTAEESKEKNSMDAIRAAIGMRRALEQMNDNDLKEFGIQLETGIGINFGTAYLGMLGHPAHQVFSVVGDPVNVASRIQGLTKKLGANILISDSIYKNVAKENLVFGNTFEPFLVGKKEQISLHELIGFDNIDIHLELQTSLHMLMQKKESFVDIFYQKLFKVAPRLKTLFKSSMTKQVELMGHMLSSIVYSLTRPEHLVLGLNRLGKSHQGYGVKTNYYSLLKEPLSEAIAEVLKEDYTPKMEKAWTHALDLITKHMTSE